MSNREESTEGQRERTREQRRIEEAEESRGSRRELSVKHMDW